MVLTAFLVTWLANEVSHAAVVSHAAIVRVSVLLTWGKRCTFSVDIHIFCSPARYFLQSCKK